MDLIFIIILEIYNLDFIVIYIYSIILRFNKLYYSNLKYRRLISYIYPILYITK